MLSLVSTRCLSDAVLLVCSWCALWCVLGVFALSQVVEHLPANCDVTVTWPTPAACVTAPSTGCPVPPKPTPDQVVYHRMEVGALISFNMATAAGSQGCGPGYNGSAITVDHSSHSSRFVQPRPARPPPTLCAVISAVPMLIGC